MSEQVASKSKSSSSKKAKDIKSLTGRQKAAIFLVSLGSEVSSDIFKHLREDEIETLTFEIARLENIDAELKENVKTLLLPAVLIMLGNFWKSHWEAKRPSILSID